MFFTQYWLRMKSFAVERSTFFWTSIFPFLLATLFYFAFGKYLVADTMEPIPTAVVYENNADSGFDSGFHHNRRNVKIFDQRASKRMHYIRHNGCNYNIADPPGRNPVMFQQIYDGDSVFI